MLNLTEEDMDQICSHYEYEDDGTVTYLTQDELDEIENNRIIAIVVSVLVVLIFICILWNCCCKKKKRHQREDSEDSEIVAV